MTYSTRHYGAGDPDCPICKGVGYVRHDVPEDHPHFGRIFDCQCRQAMVEAERRSYLQRLGGLESLQDKTFETFNPEGVGLQEKEQDSLRRVYERCQAYAQNPRGWIALTGGYGSGKTHLAAAIANSQAAQGSRVLFITAPDLLDHLRASYRPGDDQEDNPPDRFEQVRTIGLLVIDDLGTESPTPWAVEKLYQVLNHRYNAHLPTVITTNRNLEELEMRLRSRLFDPDVCEIIALTAPDYRRSGVSFQQSELNNLGLYSGMTFETFKQRKDLTKDQKDNLQRSLASSKEFADSPAGWMVLMGEYGCGKTHLAAAIANWRARQGNPVMFVTVPDLLDHLRSAFAPDSSISYDKRFSEVKTTALLVLDDLNTESMSPWVREKLHQLFNHRFTAKLPTVITTAQELEKIDERLAVRMRDKRLCNIVAILAPAYLGERQPERGQ